MVPPDDALPITVTLSRAKLAEAISARMDVRSRYDDRATAFNDALDKGVATATAALVKVVVEVAESLAASHDTREAIKVAYLDGLKAGAYQRGVKAAKAGKGEGGLL